MVNFSGLKEVSSLQNLDPETSDMFSNMEPIENLMADEPDPSVSMSRGIPQQVAQGLTFGLSDEIVAALSAVPAAFSTDTEIKAAYEDILSNIRSEQKEFSKENPGISLASQFAGGVATGRMGAGKLAASKAFKNLPKAVKAVVVPAAVGAVEGGVTGAGMAEGGLEERVSGAEKGAKTGALFGGIFGAASYGGSDLIKRAFRGGEAGRQSVVEVLEEFSEISSSPSIGQATGGEIKQGIETLSSRVFGGGPVNRALKKTTDKMQQRLKKIADDISPVAGEEEAGAVIVRGISGESGFVNRFQEKSGRLWNKFDSLINQYSEIVASKTTSILDELVSETDIGAILNNSLVRRIRQALEEQGGIIDYREFRELRSSVGERLSSPDLISEIPKAQLKRLYGALSEDLRTIAEDAGPEAVSALNRANKYTRSGHTRIDDYLERLTKKVDLDKVFQQVAKGGEGTKAINAVKRSLQPHEWNVVASNIIRRLGKATSGRQDDIGEVFSVSKMLTDWNRLGPAKKAIFSGTKELDEYRKNLDVIASVANRFKQDVAAMANSSGTAQQAANIGIIASAGASLASGNLGAFGLILAGVSANNGAARLMTNPKFVKWLAKTPKVADWPNHIGKLAVIADQSSKEDAESIMQLTSDIQESVGE